MYFAAVFGRPAALAGLRILHDRHAAGLCAAGVAREVAHLDLAGGFLASEARSAFGALRARARGERTAFSVRMGWSIGGAEPFDGSTPRDRAIAPDAGEYLRVEGDFGSGGSFLRAYSDPAGSWPLFTAASGGNVVVSNDALACARILGLTCLDGASATAMLVFGQALGRSSTIRGVERVWPGEAVTVESDGRAARLALQSVHPDAETAYSRAAAPPGRCFGALVEGCRSALAAVAGAPVAQISGGLDSRLTLGALARAGHADIPALTLDISDADEARIAAEVARRLGFGHRLVGLEGFSRGLCVQGFLATGGQVSATIAAANVCAYRAASAQGATCIVGAWPGDCLIGAYVPRGGVFHSRRRRAEALRLWMDARFFLTRDVLAGVPGLSAALPGIRDELIDTLERLPGVTAAQTISYWAMYRRQPAFSYLSPARLLPDVLEVTPCLAPAYLAELRQLSSAQIEDKHFYRRLLLEALPELADIPYHRTGRALSDRNPPLARQRGAVIECARRLARELLSRGEFWVRQYYRVRPQRIANETSRWAELLAPQTRVWPAGDWPHRVLGPATRVRLLESATTLAWTESYIAGGDLPGG